MNRLRESMDLQESANEGVAESVGKLFQLDKLQGQHIERLELTLRVLTQMLAERGLLDTNELERRFHQALGELEASRRPPQASPRGPQMVTCVRCRASIDARRAFITGDGNVCANCNADG